MISFWLAILPLGKTEDPKEEYDGYKKTYNDTIEGLFCYKTYSDEQHDIFSFKIKSLNQNINIALPTVLVFNKLPQSIDVEIRSKYFPSIIKNSIKIINQEQS